MHNFMNNKKMYQYFWYLGSKIQAIKKFSKIMLIIQHINVTTQV